jgi:hypothetical protein
MTSLNFTRRSMLTGAGTAIAAAAFAVPVTAGETAAQASLECLIENHNQAYAAHEDACGMLMNAQDSIRDLPEILAPVTVYPDGTPGDLCDTRIFSDDEIRATIARRHAELRKVHCGPWAQKMAGSYNAALLAELAASEQRALDGLDTALAAKAEREGVAGIPDLESAVKSTRIAEEGARRALVLYRPLSAAEAQTKAEYIDRSTPLREVEFWEPDFLNTLIDSLGEVA